MGHPISTDPYIVAVDAGGPRDTDEQKGTWFEGISPSLSKVTGLGHWVTSKQRRQTIPEMLRLQGMDPSKLKLGTSPRNLGCAVGNSISVNILERLLLQILYLISNSH